MIKAILLLFIFSITFFLILVLGEKIATKNKYPKFTKWWRENWVGIEDELN